MKKALICGVALAFFCSTGLVTMAMADNGPAEITLQSTIDGAKKAKPATFPHAKHQEKLKCADCHHSKGADGKMVAFVEGQKIEKCESCHNKAAGMPKGLDTFKNAAHKKCKGCHKASGNKALTKCGTCHPKK
ncbi:MAG: cytochrome c family protein [Desulfobulbaceae bacterium]|nr:cytochrome c family protein [Desulfobulbaceae bacterium]